MHPAIGYQLAQAHLAGLRHQAQRDTLARAARRGPATPVQASTADGAVLGTPGAGGAGRPRHLTRARLRQHPLAARTRGQPTGPIPHTGRGNAQIIRQGWRRMAPVPGLVS